MTHVRYDRSTVEPGAIRHIFVYGTLRPGDVRWPLLEPYVADAGRVDLVTGELFDTGFDYPAALFNDRSTIHGRLYGLIDGSIRDCLDHLDRVEGTVQGLYRRVIVRTESGRVSWAYEYGGGLDLTPIPSGDWLNR